MKYWAARAAAPVTYTALSLIFLPPRRFKWEGAEGGGLIW